MKWIKIAIGAVVAISAIPMIVSAVTGLTAETVYDVDGTTVITAGGALEGTVSGTLLDLAPLVFVASILGFLFIKTRSE